MFRRGGPINEGIMTGLVDRRGYAEGDVVEDESGYSFQDFAESPVGGGLMYGIPGALADMFYTPANLIGRAFGYNPGWSARKDIREQKDALFGEDREGRMTDEEVERSNFLGIPFSAKTGSTGAHATGETQTDSEIIDLTKDVPDDADPGDGITQGKNESGDMSESDLKTVYADLLPMFKETLGVDDKEFTRDKYLELAKFGTNLMGQPGGSLTQAIGKAAGPSLEGLGKIAASKRAAEQRPAELALQAALKEATPGSIGKGVRDLMKLGKTKAEAIKIVTEQGTSGIASQRLKYDMVKDLKEDMQRDFGIKKGLSGASEKMYESEELGVMITDYEKLPEDKKDRKHGSYYVDPKSGKVGRYNKPTGELIEPGDKGFTAKATK